MPRWNVRTLVTVRLTGVVAAAVGVALGVADGVAMTVGVATGDVVPLDEPPPLLPPTLVPPVPVSEIDCGESVALSVRTSEALRAPFAPGVKVTPMTQVAPMGMLALEQVSVAIEKSLACVPDKVAAPAPKVRVSEPLLEIAKVVAVEVEPVVTVPNAADDGEADTDGMATCTEPAVKAPDLVAPVWSVVTPVLSASGA